MNDRSAAIRIGIAGLGWPGEQHAKAIASLPSVRLAAVCDLDEERRAAFAEQFSPGSVYADYHALLADPDVDAVVIALPNSLHRAVTLAALRAGKHVLCEKPPTMNMAEIEEIRAEVIRSGLVYCFGRQSRFSAATLSAKSLVAGGTLGDVYFVKAERVRSRGVPVWGGGWFLDAARAGGGAMIDIGIHALDDAWFLLGCPKPLSVSAQVSARFRHLLPDGVASTVEDNGVAFVRFAGGIVMHLEVAWAANVTSSVPPSPWAGHELENTTLYGTRATLQLNPLTLYTMENMERRESIYPTNADSQPFGMQMDDFLRAIRAGSRPVNDVDQAVDLMKMLGAIYQSSAQGSEVKLT